MYQGLVVKGETHVLKFVGLNSSAVYWIDIFSHLFVVKIVIALFEKMKINKKEAGDVPFLKKGTMLFCHLWPIL